MGKIYAVGMILAMTVVGLTVLGCSRGSDIGSASWPSISSGGSEKGGLRVWVFDLAGDPVGKATIELLTETAGLIARVGITGDNGIYEFSDAVVGTYNVRVTKGALSVERRWVTVTPENIEPCEIQLGVSLGVLEGRTVDQSGQNLANVTILVTSTTNPTTSVTGTATATTGIDGTFRISLASDTYWLAASKTGYLTASRSVNVSGPGFHQLSSPIVLSVGEGVLRGTVVDNSNQPVNDAMVEVRSLTNPLTAVKDSPMRTGSTITIPGTGDAGDTTLQLGPGAFQFSLAPGSYSIQATKDTLSSVIETRVVTAGIETPITLKLQTIPAIAGKISGYDLVSNTFVGLEGVTVEVGNGTATFSTQTVTGGDYTLPVTSGTFRVSLTKTGYMPETRSGIVVGDSSVTLNADIFRFPIINGTVSAMQNSILTPQDNVQVKVLATQSGILTLKNEGLTISGGQYSLEVQTTGAYRVEFTKQGFLPMVRDIDIASRGRTLNVTLGDLPQVRGVVQRPDPSIPGAMSPLENVTVSAVNTVTLVRTEAFSGTDGSFVLHLEAGTYDITYFLSGYVSETVTNRVVGVSGLILDNQVLYLPAKLTGTIYTQTETGTDLTFTALSDALIRVSRSGSEITSVLSDSQGKYQFTLASGTYTLDINKQGYIATTVVNVVVPASGRTQDVTILKYPAIRGTIVERDATGGNPQGLPGVNVQATNTTTNRIYRTTTNDSGQYFLTVDPSTGALGDSYDMIFTKELYQELPRVGDPAVRVTVEKKDVVQDVSMYRLVLRGFVYQSSGAGLEGCRILASGTLGNPTIEYNAFSENTGAYTILIPSTPFFNVSFAKPGYKTVTGQLTTNGNMAYDVTLYQFSSISGYVLASGTNAAVAGANVRILDNATGNIVTSAVANEKGYYFIDNIQNGTYGFSVLASGFKTREGVAAGTETISDNARIKDFYLDSAP